MPNLTNTTIANLTGNQTGGPLVHLISALQGLQQFISGVNNFLLEVIPLALAKVGINLPGIMVWFIAQIIIWGPTVLFITKKLYGKTRKLGLIIVFGLAAMFVLNALGVDVLSYLGVGAK